MKLSKLALYAAGAFISVAAIGSLAAPKLSAAIKAAFVEIVVPSHPFTARLNLFSGKPSAGPDTGTWGVSSITLTNYDAAPQQVFIFAPVMSGGGCGTGSVVGGGDPSVQVYVQPLQTLHLVYPTPLVFSGISGHTCIAAEVTTVHTGTLEMVVNGFVN